MGYWGRLGPAAEEEVVAWYAPFTVTVRVFAPEPPVAITTCGSRISVPGGCDDDADMAAAAARVCCPRPRGMLAFELSVQEGCENSSRIDSVEMPEKCLHSASYEIYSQM